MRKTKAPLLAVLLALAACAKPLSFTRYEAPTKEFSAEVPANWPLETSGSLEKGPGAELMWVGQIVKEAEGVPFGAVLYVTKLRRDGRPALADTDALFAGKAPADVRVETRTVGGLPARAFLRDYSETIGGGLHGKSESVALRAEGLVIQTPAAYYVLEYRAVPELYEKYRPALDRLEGSFALPK